MLNHVFSSLNDEDRAEVKELITKLEAKLRPVCQIMTPDEQHELPKPRVNFDNYLPLLMAIVEECHLDLAETPIDDLKRNMETEEQMHAFMLQLENLHVMAQDTYRLSRAKVWDAFLNYYGVIKAMASRNAALTTRLKPILDFMSNGPRKNGGKAKEIKEEDMLKD